jgi:hypothetical protein
MVKIKYLIIGILIVIIGVAVAISFFTGEERKVKKQFHFLSEWVSKAPDENVLNMLQKNKKIGTLFDEPCTLKVSNHSLSGSYKRDEIVSYAMSARSHVSQLDLKFYDFNIVFPEKEIAKVTLTARLLGKSTVGEQVDETRELECVLKKIESKWLFNEIEVVEVLKK